MVQLLCGPSHGYPLDIVSVDAVLDREDFLEYCLHVLGPECTSCGKNFRGGIVHKVEYHRGVQGLANGIEEGVGDEGELGEIRFAEISLDGRCTVVDDGGDKLGWESGEHVGWVGMQEVWRWEWVVAAGVSSVTVELHSLESVSDGGRVFYSCLLSCTERTPSPSIARLAASTALQLAASSASTSALRSPNPLE